MKLHVAENLSLPADAVTEKLAFIGRTGSGKTYAAQKLAECMHATGAQIIALDPVGKWWSLRLAADGKAPGISLPVFGGLQGDVPLEPSAGKLIADVIVDRGVSAVVDVSQFESDADKARFMTDFGARFFFRKKADPSAVHIFIEEAQEFVPQNPQRDEARMLHAWTRIQKLGRNFGIGTSLLTQRPQEVNKKVLNQTEVLFVFQLTGPQEREAVARWIEEKGIEEDIADVLPRLERGCPHVWSPAWLQISKVVKISPKDTYDASSTPKVGAKAKPVKQLSPIDLEKLQEDMRGTIEKAKAEDPKELRKQITELKAQLAKRPKEDVVRVEEKIVEVPVLKNGQLDRTEKVIAQTEAITQRMMAELTELRKIVSPAFAGPVRQQQPKTRPAPAPAKEAVSRPSGPIRQRAPRTVPAAADTDTTLGKCELAILRVLAQHPEGCDSGKLTLLAGYRYSGGFKNALSNLRGTGLMEGENTSVMVITDAGREAAPTDPLPTGTALIDYWLNHRSFGKNERAVLEALVAVYPQGMNAEKLCEATGYQYSGGFKNALSNLRTAGVIEGRNTETMRASAELF